MSDDKKTKVKIFYTGYVINLGERSSRVCAAMHRVQAEFDFQRWNGRLESLPTDEAVLVDAFTIRANEPGMAMLTELVEFCAEHGHLLFEGNRAFLQDGTQTDNWFWVRKIAEHFSDRHRARVRTSPART